MKTQTKTIKVDCLARVEGEGALYIKVKENQVADVKLKIFESPRFFEAFLRGHHYSETPDITARICGICPIAYQMSAVHAMGDAFGVKVEGQLRALRRLIYCGEWIESHVWPIYMLHAPDFLGYPDAIHAISPSKRYASPPRCPSQSSSKRTNSWRCDTQMSILLTKVASSRIMGWIWNSMNSPGNANKPSATTTPASPPRHTS